MICVDNSILTAMATCDTRTAVRYVLGYASREERATLKSGTAGHEAMAVYFRSLGDADAALQTYNDLYADWSRENLPPEDARSIENTLPTLQQWFVENPVNRLPFRIIPQWVEIGFSFPLDDQGQYVLIGKIDAIVQEMDNDHLRILDHKFTGRLDGAFAKRYTMDSQFSGYIWAAHQQLGYPIDGGFVNGVEFRRLPSDPTRKCSRHGVPYSECGFLHTNSKIILVNRTPLQIARWKRDALHLAKRYEELCRIVQSPDYIPAVKQQGQFVYNACNNCVAYDFCAAGRPTQHIDSLFEHSPWEPWEHARVDDPNNLQDSAT